MEQEVHCQILEDHKTVLQVPIINWESLETGSLFYWERMVKFTCKAILKRTKFLLKTFIKTLDRLESIWYNKDSKSDLRHGKHLEVKDMKINIKDLRHGILARGSSALSQIGNSFFSYTTRIAWTDNVNRILYCNPRKYSVTTSKQVSALKAYYINHGFHVTEIGW